MRINDIGTILLNKEKDIIIMQQNAMEIITETGIRFKLPYDKIKGSKSKKI